MLYLVIDLGTTNTKITCFDRDMNPVSSTGFTTPFEGTSPRVIQPKGLMDRLSEAVSDLRINELPSDEVAVSVTGMGSTVLAASRNGQVLFPAVNWADRVDTRPIPDFPVAKTGKVSVATYPLYKINWLRRQIENPDDALFVSLPDYVLSALQGFTTWTTDHSFASRSMLFDDFETRWDEKLLNAVGIKSGQLPETLVAGTRLSAVDSRWRLRLKLPAEVFCYTGMHDHIATVYTAYCLSRSQKQSVIVNATGTTESIMQLTRKREQLIMDAPRFQFNTESSWDRELLGLVGYSTPSGKILQAAKAIDLYDPQGWNVVEPHFIAYPPRRRLHETDNGKILINTPELREINMLTLVNSLVLSTQFEARLLIEDLNRLTDVEAQEEVNVFGGQSADHGLCQLKSNVLQRRIVAHPFLNAAALGVAMCIRSKTQRQTESGGMEDKLPQYSSKHVYTPQPGTLAKLNEHYLRYKSESERF